MKKLYLLFLMLLIMFIPVTHSIAIYQLDQPIKELNNYTLREVFENRNIAMANWIGKPLIESNVYRLYDSNGVTVDYNVLNGIYTRNGTSTSNIYIPLTNNISGYNNQHMTMKIYRVSGTIQVYPFIVTGANFGANMNVGSNEATVSKILNNPSNNRIEIYNPTGVIGLVQFKLQLEKGSISTPYQVPTNGPYSDIDISQFNLSSGQIQTYYNLYLEAVRFEQENIEAIQDEGGYQNIFKSILDGVKNLMQEMGNVWNFLNAPIITNDMQNYQPPNIDWSWDIIGVVRQIINNANTLAFQLLFVVPSLIYSLLGIPIHISLLSLLFSNLIFLLLGWIVVKSFII